MRRGVRFAWCLGSALLASAASRATVTVRFAVWDGDAGLGVIREAVRGFERAHPDIKVKLENVPYGAFAQKLLAGYAANAAPDVAMMEPKGFQRFAKRGGLLPLDPFFAQTPDVKIEEYYRPIVDAMRYQGRLYVLPRDIAPIGIVFYNKRLFREAGIPDPDGTWTWDWEPRPELRDKDFTWVMQKLTKFDAKGKVVQWGFVPAWTRAFADTVVYSQGARYVDDPVDPTRWTWDDPRVVRAYQWVADLGLKKHWIPASTEITSVLQTSSDQLFLQQRAAMFQGGMWSVPGFRQVLKPGTKEFFEWDVTLAPGHIDQATGRVVRAAPTGGSGYAVMASTRHPKEAWLLTTWMAGPPAMRLMAQAGLAQPAIRKLALEEPWVPGPNTPEEQRYPPSRKVTDQAVPYVVVDPTAECYAEINTFVESKVDSIMSGSKSAQAAIDEGQGQANSRLSQILKQERLPLFDWRSGLGAGLIVAGLLVAWVYLPSSRGRRTRSERAENRAAYAFVSPWIVGMVAFCAGPMLFSLLLSTTDWDIVTAAKWRGGGNFAEAFTQDPRFWNSLKVSVVYTALSVPLGLVVSLAMALLLNVKVRGVPLFRTCFYLPALASTVATCLVYKKVFQADGGLLNAAIYGPDGRGDLFGIGSLLTTWTHKPGPANWLGDETLALPSLILMSLWTAGGAMVILLAGLQGIPQHYHEAATLDGAGPWRRFLAVTVPMLAPSLFFCLITGVIGSFQTFTQAFVMTGGGPGDATRFYILHLYSQAFENLRMGYASALAWILFAVILVFTLLQWRLNKFVYYEGDK
ncbi:MAG: extracellular solute-binding protein [Armatimonadetes bacterium]|nr:extracellular solute-binding protein [Armatimonadota bacterium]